MKYLMTQSLISSWLYMWNAREVYEEPARLEFLKSLQRERTPTTEAQQRGIDFEQLVYDTCDGKADGTHEWQPCADQIAKEVTGAARQIVGSKTVSVGVMEFLLYGRLDGLKNGVIYDIKMTKYYECGKFFNSPQHPMYFEIIPNAHTFKYLVTNGRSVWTETYTREESRDIKRIVAEFVEWITENGLMELYKEKWRAKR